jgi:hypothetical protein
LDFLGFIRSIRGFSKRYGRKNQNFFSPVLLGSDMQKMRGVYSPPAAHHAAVLGFVHSRSIVSVILVSRKELSKNLRGAAARSFV